MRTIELTSEQVAKVIDALAEAHDTCDNFNVEVELDDLTVTAEGWVDILGHDEDDAHCGYMNGTGAFVEDYRAAAVTLTGWAYNQVTEDCEEVAIDRNSEKKIEEYLNAA